MHVYEYARIFLEPFLPALYRKARHDLREIIAASAQKSGRVMDVGGSKSPYTVGLNARVVILDLPRENELQDKLNLGISEALLRETRRRRTNIENILLKGYQVTWNRGFLDIRQE